MSLQFMQNAIANPNVLAFFHTIRMSECGTDDCYNFLFGSSINNTLRFTDFSHHPNIPETFNNITSTAAGAFQILYFVWKPIQIKYNLPDFGVNSQNIAGAELISERNVLEILMNGGFNEALSACSKTWASLPNSPYGQPTHSIAVVTNWYTEAGGQIIT